MNLLVIAHDIEPLESPQAIQIGRLLGHLKDCGILLASGGKAVDAAPAAGIPGLLAHLRWPGAQGPETTLARIARLALPLVAKTPDGLGAWRDGLQRRLLTWVNETPDKPDLIVSFGEPMSDHLLALEMKRHTGLPWLAHFSDPWADNPFRRGGPLTTAMNRKLERDVIEGADLVVFTSQETVDLVGRRYAASETGKFRVLPHGFDPRLYPQQALPEGPIIIRHIGSFYGNRTPFPLIEALRILANRDGDIARRIRVELVGSMPERMAKKVKAAGLPAGLLRLAGSVRYAESIRLMAESDLLVLVDAPATKSVFLASKLIDYVGAGRPILAITPEGAAKSVVTRLGGLTAPPESPKAIADALLASVQLCEARRRENTGSSAWGEPMVRETYRASHVAATFRGYLEEAVLHRTSA